MATTTKKKYGDKFESLIELRAYFDDCQLTETDALASFSDLLTRCEEATKIIAELFQHHREVHCPSEDREDCGCGVWDDAQRFVKAAQ